MEHEQPSPLALALFDNIAESRGGEYALSVAKTAADLSREVSDRVLDAHGVESLYILQAVGEMFLGIVQHALVELASKAPHPSGR